ncbi:MAG TPA: hypothetical protein VMZ31_08755 [Phycisphaerae bacterium]|nr:hypothetical protein [Phycisphaerae bacterium]
MSERNAWLTLTVVACTCVVEVAAAQELDLSWHTIDGGGQMTSTGGDFELSATIGQPDAGAMSGGDLELVGGFWALKASLVLVSTEPPADGTLPKTQNNIIVCAFDAPITLPPSGDPLVITELADPNNDVSASFSYSIDPNDTGDPTGQTLKATESGPVLPDLTWYHVRSASGWATVTPFAFDVCTLRGDANNSARVTTADYSEVKGHMGERTDARYDLNGSARVTTADYTVVKDHMGHRAAAKP